MNNNKFFIRILSTKKWRDWWINRLVQQKSNRLYDLETRKPMIIEKRIHVEKPRLEDYIDFLGDNNVIITIRKNREGISVQLGKKANDKIFKAAPSSLKAMELALQDYLKESNMTDRW